MEPYAQHQGNGSGNGTASNGEFSKQEADAALVGLLELLAEAASTSTSDDDSRSNSNAEYDQTESSRLSGAGQDIQEDIGGIVKPASDVVPSQPNNTSPAPVPVSSPAKSRPSQIPPYRPDASMGTRSTGRQKAAQWTALPPPPPSEITKPLLTDEQLGLLRTILAHPQLEANLRGQDSQGTAARLKELVTQSNVVTTTEVFPDLLTLLHRQLTEAPQPKTRSPRSRLGGFTIFALMIGAIAFLFTQYRARVAQSVEQDIQLALASVPTLSTYHFQPQVQRKKVNLKGRLPSQTLRNDAETVVQQAFPDLEVDNNIIVVEAATGLIQQDAEALASPSQQEGNTQRPEADMQRMVEAFNQVSGVAIAGQILGDRAVLEGNVLAPVELDAIANSFEQIPGINTVENQISTQDIPVATRLYFESNSAVVRPIDLEGKLAPLVAWLMQYPSLSVRIVGYARAGEIEAATLAQSRAEAVQLSIEEQGIDLQRLSSTSTVGPPPGVTASSPEWRSQTVLFEWLEPSE